jgi:hypothetical protein
MAKMTDADILKVASAAVPEHLKSLGRIIARYDGPTATTAGLHEFAAHQDIADEVAKEVGAKPAKSEPDSADVEFVEHTPIGSRSTVVHVRAGKVTRVLKRA